MSHVRTPGMRGRNQYTPPSVPPSDPRQYAYRAGTGKLLRLQPSLEIARAKAAELRTSYCDVEVVVYDQVTGRWNVVQEDE